jgi:carbon storage regulator
MLVLSRKQGEQVRIGGNVTVTVLGVSRGVLKLGIEAPASVRILRGELARTSAAPRGEHSRAREAEPLMV